VNGSKPGLGVALGASVKVGASGLGVNEGFGVGVSEGGMFEVARGREVSVCVGAGWMDRIGILPHDTTTKRINIIIKKRRMDIL
jgi:hypothetical protein